MARVCHILAGLAWAAAVVLCAAWWTRNHGDQAANWTAAKQDFILTVLPAVVLALLGHLCGTFSATLRVRRRTHLRAIAEEPDQASAVTKHGRVRDGRVALRAVVARHRHDEEMI